MLKIEGIEPENDLYKADFLTKEFADELFELCKTLPNERPVIPRSVAVAFASFSLAYIRLPDTGQVRG